MITRTLEAIRNGLESRAAVRIRDPLAAQAAVALILVPTASDLEALFIRRAEIAGDPWSGHMALPGGRMQATDQDLLATAIRETAEETGVSLSPRDHLGALDDFAPLTPTLPRIVVQPHVFALPSRPEVRLSPEVAGCLWFSLETLRTARRQAEVNIRGVPTGVSAFVVGQDIVWGLTERILSPFMELAAKLG